MLYIFKIPIKILYYYINNNIIFVKKNYMTRPKIASDLLFTNIFKFE